MKNKNIISEQKLRRIVRESIWNTLKDKAKGVKNRLRTRMEQYGQDKGYLPGQYKGKWARSWNNPDEE